MADCTGISDISARMSTKNWNFDFLTLTIRWVFMRLNRATFLVFLLASETKVKLLRSTPVSTKARMDRDYCGHCSVITFFCIIEVMLDRGGCASSANNLKVYCLHCVHARVIWSAFPLAFRTPLWSELWSLGRETQSAGPWGWGDRREKLRIPVLDHLIELCPFVCDFIDVEPSILRFVKGQEGQDSGSDLQSLNGFGLFPWKNSTLSPNCWNPRCAARYLL